MIFINAVNSGQWLVASYSAYGEATSGAKSPYELCLPVAG